MRATEREKKAKGKAKASVSAKSKSSRADGGKAEAKAKALAAVDALLKQPAASAGKAPSATAKEAKREAAPSRAGATAAGMPKVAGPKQAEPKQLLRSSESKALPQGETLAESRFERSILRAQKGEPGPIKLADLILDQRACDLVTKAGRVELYTKILRDNPAAQPGRPLVNIIGSGDADLGFQLLSLHDLVLAARSLGRETLQVLLVRLTPGEAEDLLASPEAAAPAASLTPLEIARMNGFLELPLGELKRDENLRQVVATDSAEFRNLVESIRTIGLQNPPVVEVRPDPESGAVQLVCISGHRRLLALESLGMDRVTCALKSFKSDRHRALAGLAENINREDLHFLDKADGYGLLAKQGMTAHEIAALLDADHRTVGKYLRASAWDASVKRRIRDLGTKATTRFLLNMLAAGERTTEELHAIIARFVAHSGPAVKPARGAQVRQKLDEFFALSEALPEQRALVEKALRFLGYLR